MPDEFYDNDIRGTNTSTGRTQFIDILNRRIQITDINPNPNLQKLFLKTRLSVLIHSVTKIIVTKIIIQKM